MHLRSQVLGCLSWLDITWAVGTTLQEFSLPCPSLPLTFFSTLEGQRAAFDIARLILPGLVWLSLGNAQGRTSISCSMVSSASWLGDSDFPQSFFWQLHQPGSSSPGGYDLGR
jgi:hypothetical protein